MHSIRAPLDAQRNAHVRRLASARYGVDRASARRRRAASRARRADRRGRHRVGSQCGRRRCEDDGVERIRRCARPWRASSSRGASRLPLPASTGTLRPRAARYSALTRGSSAVPSARKRRGSSGMPLARRREPASRGRRIGLRDDRRAGSERHGAPIDADETERLAGTMAPRPGVERGAGREPRQELGIGVGAQDETGERLRPRRWRGRVRRAARRAARRARRTRAPCRARSTSGSRAKMPRRARRGSRRRRRRTRRARGRARAARRERRAIRWRGRSRRAQSPGVRVSSSERSIVATAPAMAATPTMVVRPGARRERGMRGDREHGRDHDREVSGAARSPRERQRHERRPGDEPVRDRRDGHLERRLGDGTLVARARAGRRQRHECAAGDRRRRRDRRRSRGRSRARSTALALVSSSRRSPPRRPRWPARPTTAARPRFGNAPAAREHGGRRGQRSAAPNASCFVRAVARASRHGDSQAGEHDRRSTPSARSRRSSSSRGRTTRGPS